MVQVVALVQSLMEDKGVKQREIGIVTPYYKQVSFTP